LFKYKASPNYKNLNEAVHAVQQKGIEPKFYNKNRFEILSSKFFLYDLFVTSSITRDNTK
jgi:hypothetical protein